MAKALGARESAPFLSSDTERASAKRPPQRRRRAGLVDAVIGGERVLLATNPEPLERGIELQIRVALNAAGIMCMKHRIEVCPHCGGRPKKGQGLGLGCADLICVVPPYGRFLGVEVKRPSTRNAKRDEHQRKWMAVIRRYGGVAGVATNEEEALALVELARRLP
jgi:VRR-NUC domain